MGQYHDALELRRGKFASKSDLEKARIRHEKHSRCRARNAERQRVRQDEAEKRNRRWESLPLNAKLDELSKRPAMCLKQRMKLLKSESRESLAVG